MPGQIATIREAFTLIVPDADGEALLETFDFLRAVEPDSKITAFHGFSTFKGIKVESSGFDVEGTIKGTVKSHSFRRLYEVYNLPSSSSWKLWAVKFKKDKTQSVLKQVFNEEDPVDLAVDMRFEAKAKDLAGVKFFRVGFETIKLKLAGVEKNFTVVNPESGSGRDEEGNEIPVDFQPI